MGLDGEERIVVVAVFPVDLVRKSLPFLSVALFLVMGVRSRCALFTFAVIAVHVMRGSLLLVEIKI